MSSTSSVAASRVAEVQSIPSRSSPRRISKPACTTFKGDLIETDSKLIFNKFIDHSF